jgi:hypothetical protein
MSIAGDRAEGPRVPHRLSPNRSRLSKQTPMIHSDPLRLDIKNRLVGDVPDEWIHHTFLFAHTPHSLRPVRAVRLCRAQ